MVRAGDLIHRVQILNPVDSVLASGGPTQSWNLLLTVSASIEPLSGTEFYAAKQVDADVTHKITMRHNRLSILPSYRLASRGRIFNISSVINPREEGEMLVITCTEKTGVPGETVLVQQDDDNQVIIMEPD